VGRVKTDDPDVIEYKSGGGCLMLFGLPFLLAGLFVMASTLLPGKYQPKDSDTGKPMPIYFAIPFGGVFALVGAGLMFGRAGKRIDRRAGTATTWWGLLVPFRTKTYPLSDFEKVTITREVRRSKNSSYTVYPVRTAGASVKSVTIEEPRSEDKARALGEEVAKFLGLPLHDSSTGAVIIRAAEELDESLRDRARRTGERVEVGDPPADRRSTQSVLGDTLTFDIPPPGFRAVLLIPIAVGIGIAVFVSVLFLVPILSEEKMPLFVKLIFCGFLGVFFIALPLVAIAGGALSAARTATQVAVSPHELRVTTKGLMFTRTAAIPSSELEELEVAAASRASKGGPRAAFSAMGGGNVLIARSDNATLSFGAGLSLEELRWMRAVIWNVVTA